MLEVLEYTGDGYQTLMAYGDWRVALINHSDRFDEGSLEEVERHLETDEVFILLSGRARLIIGKELQTYPMEPNKIYNVPAKVWHHIHVSPDATVAIVENRDTGTENTEYWSVPKEDAKLVTKQKL